MTTPTSPVDVILELEERFSKDPTPECMQEALQELLTNNPEIDVPLKKFAERLLELSSLSKAKVPALK